LAKAHSPIFYWGQKRCKEINKARAACRKENKVYLGPTMLSDLVSFKCKEIAQEIDALLEAEKLNDPEFWGPVRDQLPETMPGLRKQGMELVHSIVFLGAAAWDTRFTLEMEQLQYRVLLLPEKKSSERDPRRIDIANALLERPAALLQQNLDEDVSFKLGQMYSEELEVVSRTGCVPHSLYAWSLIYRANLDDNTEDIEGLHSRLGRFSSRIQQPAADAKMSIKAGAQTSPSEAVNINARITEFMDSEEHSTRYLPSAICDGDDVPNAFQPPPNEDEGHTAEVMALAAAFAYDAQKKPRLALVRFSSYRRQLRGARRMCPPGSSITQYITFVVRSWSLLMKPQWCLR